MLICVNCKHENLEGELLCRQCGVELDNMSVSTIELAVDSSLLSTGSLYLGASFIILVQVLGEDEPIAMRIDDRLILGRDDDSGFDIDFDLEPYDAGKFGVSREHAMLSRKGQQLFVQDLHSTNHTFLNGDKLTPGLDYALRDSDELRLSSFPITIYFKR